MKTIRKFKRKVYKKRINKLCSMEGVTIDRKAKLKLYNENLKKYLRIIGAKLGFESEREWKTELGSIDIVWYKNLIYPLINGEKKLPIVGFEIESSSRTRKHLKGDILNLISLSPSLGVIILIEKGYGRGKKRESNFKSQTEAIKKYINSFRGLCKLELWTSTQVEEFYNKVVDKDYNFFKRS